MIILSVKNVEIHPGSVTEPLNKFPNLAALREFTKIQEIPRKCKGFYSQPAAGRLGSDEISFKFPLNSSQIRLEASLGLWKTFKKPAANVGDLRNPRNLAATKEMVQKGKEIEVQKMA